MVARAQWAFQVLQGSVETLFRSLHYLVKLEILITQVLPLQLSDKETPEFIPSQLGPPNSPDLKPVDLITACWEYCKRRCTKHASLIWSYRRRRWWMAATKTTWSSLFHSVLSRCFSSSRSVMRIFYIFSRLRYFSHSVINWIQIWRTWRPQLQWDKFWSFFLYQLNGSTRAVNISSFTR